MILTPHFLEQLIYTIKADLPEYLPKRKALKSFILTCAIRRVRGHEKKHNSMLIHAALLVKWIDRAAYLVNDKMRNIEMQSKVMMNLLIDLQYL
jgi:hypothetical protein